MKNINLIKIALKCNGDYVEGEDGLAGLVFCNQVGLRYIFSYGAGWEHASVSIPDKKRCPTWQEMCFIKDLFWNPNECVIQYHPPEEVYINNVNNCLHLWKPINVEIPIPPKHLVGI